MTAPTVSGWPIIYPDEHNEPFAVEEPVVMAEEKVSAARLEELIAECDAVSPYETSYAVVDSTLSWNELAQALRDLSSARQEMQDVLREIQRHQPEGSPCPGGPVQLARWILETQAADLAATRQALEEASGAIQQALPFVMAMATPESVQASKRLIDFLASPSGRAR